MRRFDAPRPFHLLPRVPILRHCNAFMTNFTANVHTGQPLNRRAPTAAAGNQRRWFGAGLASLCARATGSKLRRQCRG
ncbi:hypothetical protein EVAR_30473_1 [Eumeta japonica]|uniref:Uncharacterized protein n=1 Tax=Eumeta variegata TaxID=151549 RepID=A0A4C1VW98_EUMVA|nr:hypothetical protein EVAR_30473_1 [Eumeta japonica]